MPRSDIFNLRISRRWYQIGQTLLKPHNRQLCIAFRLAYAHLTFAHSKTQGQDHAHFDCEYLVNGYKYVNFALLNVIISQCRCNIVKLCVSITDFVVRLIFSMRVFVLLVSDALGIVFPIK